MKKSFLLLLAVIVLFSCNNEEFNDVKENLSATLSTESFNVTKSDIEKIVADYTVSTATRSGDGFARIVNIDTISNGVDIQTRGATDSPRNFLYVVKLSDGSTLIVGGDKRAEPVYASFSNLNIEINDKSELVGDSIPDIVGFLVENYIVDVKNKTTDNNQLNKYYSGKQALSTRATDSNEEVLPKLAYRFTDAYNYKEGQNNDNVFTSQDIRPWTIHALCVAIPDGKEIRSFNSYALKASWKQAKKLNVTQLTGDMYKDFVEMSNTIPIFPLFPNSNISIKGALESIKKSFSGADGIPSISYDEDWYNILNNLKLETGISFIYGCRDRKHPTFFRHTSYYNFSFFLADGYKKINNDYFIHVVGPIGNHGIVSGYVLDFNRTHATRFAHTYWTEWYGAPYVTATCNIHTTKY